MVVRDGWRRADCYTATMSMPSYIPRRRTRWILADARPKHDACFFMHDEAARILVEYELAGTNVVKFPFLDRKQAREFSELAEKHDTIYAMRELGFADEARRVIMNQITFAMGPTSCTTSTRRCGVWRSASSSSH